MNEDFYYLHTKNYMQLLIVWKDLAKVKIYLTTLRVLIVFWLNFVMLHLFAKSLAHTDYVYVYERLRDKYLKIPNVHG